MKDLVQRLRLGASISRDRNLNLDYATVADDAADAIEKLEAESWSYQLARNDLALQVGQLKAELAAMRSALEIVVAAAEAVETGRYEDVTIDYEVWLVQARTALAAPGAEK